MNTVSTWAGIAASSGRGTTAPALHPTAYWAFEQQGLTNQTDSTGRGNVLTPAASGLTNVAGKINNAITFSPAGIPLDTHYSAAASVDVSPTSDWTIRFIFKLVGQDDEQTIFSTVDSAAKKGILIFYDYSTNTLSLAVYPSVDTSGGSDGLIQIANEVNQAAYNHVVCSWKASTSTLRMRINGGTAQTLVVGNGGYTASTIGAFIGDCQDQNITIFFEGNLDEMLVDNTTWTATQETNDYNAGNMSGYPGPY